MKTFLICLALVATATAGTVQLAEIELPEAYSASSMVTKLLEDIREQMPCGFPSRGIPIMAPLRIKYKDVNINRPDISAQGNVDHFELIGLNDFDIEEMKVNPILSKINFILNFKNVLVKTKYDLRLLLKKWNFTINVVGKGDAKFAIKDLKVTGLIKYTIGKLSGKIQLKAVEIRPHIDDVDSDIQGMLGDGTINRSMNNLLEQGVELGCNTNEDEIAETIQSIVMPIVNSHLEDTTLAQLIASIGGGGGEGGEKEPCIPPPLEDW